VILLGFCQQLSAAPIVKTEAIYYDVELQHASHVRTLHNILLLNSPANIDGNNALEKSGWNLDWSITSKQSGETCQASQVQTTLIKRFTLPKAVSLPTDRRIRFAYTEFLNKVAAYHKARFDILESAARDIERKVQWQILPGNCTAASKEFEAAAQQIYRAFVKNLDAFRRDSHYGYTGGYYFKRYAWNQNRPSPDIHVDFDYFEFDLENANSREAINQQLSNYSTVIRNDSKHWGSAFWLIFWDYELIRRNKGCHLDNVRSSVEIIYTMPRALTPPPNAALQSYYDRLYQNLMEHEEMHASSGIAAAHAIQKYLSAFSETGDCKSTAKTVLATVNAITAEHRARDKEFDRASGNRGVAQDYAELFSEQPWSTRGGRYQ